MLVHRRVTPSIKFAGTLLYTWVERGTVGVSVLPMNSTQSPRPGLEPAPLDPRSSALNHEATVPPARNGKAHQKIEGKGTFQVSIRVHTMLLSPTSYCV